MALKSKVRKLLKNSKGKLQQLLITSYDPFNFTVSHSDISKNALGYSKTARGEGRLPCLIIYGVTPRCGTNYISPLIELHPDIVANPNEIYEIPFLKSINNLLNFEEEFLNDYKRNYNNIGKHDFINIFGSSFIGYLHTYIPDNHKKMLLKEPDMRFISLLPVVFPYEQALFVMRDGRDVVYSTLSSWPTWSFEDACRKWQKSAKAMLDFTKVNCENSSYWMIKYEEVVQNPAWYALEICKRFGMDSSKYPTDKIDSLKVVGSSTASKNNGRVDWSLQVEKTSDFKPTGKWQKWSDKEKAIFKKIAGETLIEAEYCQDLNW